MASNLGFPRIISLLGVCKKVLVTRVSVNPTYQQRATLKLETKNKIEGLKIPERPKRPLTPYLKFVTAHRPLVKEENPSLSSTDLIRKCAEDWKKVGEDEKQKLLNAYSKELAAFVDKLNKYKSSLTKEQAEMLKFARQEKRKEKERRLVHQQWRELGRPKRPLGTYILFIQDKMKLAENKSKTLTDLMHNCKEEFKSLSEAEKQKYKKAFEIDQKRYNSEMITWETKMIKEGKDDVIRKDSLVLAKHTKKSKD